MPRPLATLYIYNSIDFPASIAIKHRAHSHFQGTLESFCEAIDLYKLYERGLDRPWAAIATRGASDASRLPADQFKPDATVLLLRQNDKANAQWYSNLPFFDPRAGSIDLPANRHKRSQRLDAASRARTDQENFRAQIMSDADFKSVGESPPTVKPTLILPNAYTQVLDCAETCFKGMAEVGHYFERNRELVFPEETKNGISLHSITPIEFTSELERVFDLKILVKSSKGKRSTNKAYSLRARNREVVIRSYPRTTPFNGPRAQTNSAES